MDISGIKFSDELCDEGLMKVSITCEASLYGGDTEEEWLDADGAIKLIEHLKDVFELTGH